MMGSCRHAAVSLASLSSSLIWTLGSGSPEMATTQRNNFLPPAPLTVTLWQLCMPAFMDSHTNSNLSILDGASGRLVSDFSVTSNFPLWNFPFTAPPTFV